jgi:hypothetical protein
MVFRNLHKHGSWQEIIETMAPPGEILEDRLLARVKHTALSCLVQARRVLRPPKQEFSSGTNWNRGSVRQPMVMEDACDYATIHHDAYAVTYIDGWPGVNEAVGYPQRSHSAVQRPGDQGLSRGVLAVGAPDLDDLRDGCQWTDDANCDHRAFEVVSELLREHSLRLHGCAPGWSGQV